MKKIRDIVYHYRLKRLQSYFAQNQLEKEAIIISGSPRGGTTWVFEVIQKTSPVFGIWEPLHPEIIQEYYPQQSFRFHKYIKQFSKNKEMKSYLGDILNGKYISTRLLQLNAKFKSYKNQDQLLVKFCRLSPMLPWFTQNFNNNKILQLYRNPLAVVASQMKHGAWKTFDKTNITKLVNEKNYTPEYYKQFFNVFESIEYPEEVLAAVWALDMIPTLKHTPPNVLKMKYEDLFLQPSKNFNQIYKHFNLSLPNNLDELIKKPSSTTKKGSNIINNPEKQLETWKMNLKDEQAKRVRKILSKFGFNHIGDVDYSLELNREIVL